MPSRPHLRIVLSCFLVASIVGAAYGDVVRVQLTTGQDSYAPRLDVAADGSVFASYVSDYPVEGGWGGSLGYAVIDTAGSAVLDVDPLFTGARIGPAQVLAHADGGSRLFHHRREPYEHYAFVAVDATGSVIANEQMTWSGGCTNTDSSDGAVDLRDGTYGFVYSSCQGTGQNNGTRNNLFYSRWTGMGVQIGTTLELASSTYVAQACVSAACRDSGVIHIAYADTRSGTEEIYYQKIDADGTQLVGETRVAEPGVSVSPCVEAGSDGRAHVFWSDTRSGTSQVYHLLLDADGVPVGDESMITDSPVSATLPAAVIDGEDRVHVVWYDWRGDRRVVYYLRMSTGDSLIVGPTPISDPDYPVACGSPSIDVDARGIAHTVWTTGPAWGDAGDVVYCRIDLDEWTGVEDPWQGGVGLTKLAGIPNPFTEQTMLAYEVTKLCHVALSVHDIRGRLVRTLVDEARLPGSYTEVWDGRDRLGNQVAAGVYFWRMVRDGVVYPGKAAYLH